MPPISRELIRGLPKAELHCHLDGSVRPETLLALAREAGRALPASDPAALAEHMVVRDARNLEDYLARFAITLSVMQRAEALERIAYELVEDAARDGVRYIEIRYAPVLNAAGGLTLEETVEAALRGIARAEREHGTIARLILCAIRTQPPETSLEVARLAVAYRASGVVALDLAGAERGHPASVHAAAFAYARRHHLAVTVHAGEGAGPESIREAVHDCGAHRIGHATHLIEDPDLAQYVNDRRIALEICLTSNVQTHAVAGYAAHPLRAYFDQGLNVVLNTDNRLMSGTTLTDEYLHAATELGFTLRELGEIALNGFASAFLPWQERRVLLARAQREIDALLACP
jgi:adenosine deaminase